MPLDVQQHFVRFVDLLSLNLVNDCISPSTLTALDRNYEDWSERIVRTLWNLHELPYDKLFPHMDLDDVGYHTIYLLQELIKLSGGTVAAPVDTTAIDVTPTDNLVLYGFVFGIEAPCPMLFGSADTGDLQEAFIRLGIVREISASDIREWTSILKASLPIGFPYHLVRCSKSLSVIATNSC